MFIAGPKKGSQCPHRDEEFKFSLISQHSYVLLV